jgi:hypothetical protein
VILILNQGSKNFDLDYKYFKKFKSRLSTSWRDACEKFSKHAAKWLLNGMSFLLEMREKWKEH